MLLPLPSAVMHAGLKCPFRSSLASLTAIQSVYSEMWTTSKEDAVGRPSHVIELPWMVIRGPFLKITTRISSGGAESGSGPQEDCKTTLGRSAFSTGEINAWAASRTLVGAVGETHRMMFVSGMIAPMENGSAQVASANRLYLSTRKSN